MKPLIYAAALTLTIISFRSIVMKKLIYATAFTLMLASWIPVAHAAGRSRDFKVSRIVHSAAHATGTRNLDATHHFEIDVEGSAISEISMDLPEGISIHRGIKITNQSGQKIPATVSIADRKATLLFGQPVTPGTTISVKIEGVPTSIYQHFWQYMVYGKMVGIDAAIPLGIAQIQTPGR
ncbi:DUF2808 domain-containing protein [Argonema galeatum]|uniref:DUF2808 domain-containing protein n=1 Tax=Argonema galeatum TaxID=2942762 RepID=UPI002011A90C|nr:DUF2808 domain-containing protein [Argonema galeatum]MCL1466226.1 DUF2808 domain-containing protein [Argonema galeatum A003/A1]